MVSELVMQVTVGALAWMLALAFPLRRMGANSELRWDLCVVVFVGMCAVAASSALSLLYDRFDGVLAPWWSAIDSWSPIALGAGYLVFADLSSYAAHRALHTKWLWHTHAVHHSPRHLYVLSGLRASPVHVVALVAGPVLALTVFPVYEMPLLLALLTFLQVANQHYTHSNIRVPFARQLEWLLVTPRYHFVHHSIERRVSNSNFGFLFSVWDRMFGTYTDPALVPATQPLGLDYETSRWRLLLGVPPAGRAAQGE